MPSYCTPKLEFSPDPVSDTTPAYTDVTTYVKSASWVSGNSSEDIPEPQAGQATFVLRNRHRDWEPEYSGGRFYPNILPLRRFRWSITADGVSYPQGTWFATSYQVEWLPGTTESTVTVTCVDGIGLLTLATQPLLDPPTAEGLGDVIDFDDPFGHWPLNETSGRTMSATIGPQGTYRGAFTLGAASPVLGDPDKAVLFSGDPVTGNTGFGRVKLDDTSIWHDSGEVTCEAVIDTAGIAPGGARDIIAGPFDSGAGDYSFKLWFDDFGVLLAWLYTNSSTAIAIGTATFSAGRHHVAMTYDGAQLILYIDGVERIRSQKDGGIVNPDVTEFLYIGGGADSDDGNTITIAHAAVYDYALSADRIAAHADAAVNRGYDTETAGERIATLATHPLWSTAGITASQITVTPRRQVGQQTFDEITETVKAETPNGLFYFNDAGNPAYEPFEYDTTVQAVFGDSSAEIQYDSFDPRYDDQLFNQSTVSRDGGLGQTAQDTTSISAYGARTHDETSLIVADDGDAAMLSQAIVDGYGNPRWRVQTIGLNGADPKARKQILSREIGDVIRIKRRGAGGTIAIDVITRILQKEKSIDTNGDLRCTWSLARGYPAGTTTWLLGQQGYSELGQTTVLA